ncbi:MAG TPA: hypothetical protein VF980_20555 [Thermoanaerobaculia bacterium]
MRWSLAVAVALFTTSLAALNVGPEFRVSDPAIEPSALTRSFPHIASNGDGFLVVWRDSTGGVVRAARLDRNGALIDVPSLVIGSQTGFGFAVGSDGSDYLVGYECAGNPDLGTCLARVTADGRVMPGAFIAAARDPAIASNGRSYLVAYHLPGPYGADPIALETVEVSRDAQTLGKPLRIVTAAIQPPKIASDGHNFLVVSGSNAELFVTIVSPSAILRDPQRLTTVLVSPTGWSVASNGDGFVVAWQQELFTKTGGTNLRTRTVGPDGTLGEERVIISAPERNAELAIAWTGATYDIVFRHIADAVRPGASTQEIRRISVDGSGEATGAQRSVSRTQRALTPDATWNGHRTVVVWTRWDMPNGVEIEAWTDGSDAPVILSNSTAWQQSVAGARIGALNVLVWEELVGPSQRHELRLQRIDDRGLALDGRGVVVTPSEQNQIAPAVSSSFVAWIEQDADGSAKGVARAKRIGSDGLPTGPTLLLGSAARDSRIAVASGDAQSLIVWVGSDNRVAGLRITNDGAQLDAVPFAIAPEGFDPIATSDGTNYLVAWSQYDEDSGIGYDFSPPTFVVSAFVTHNGEVGSAWRVVPAEDFRMGEFLTWNGSEYVLFWSAVRGSDPDPRQKLRAQRFDRNGVPLWGTPTVIARDVSTHAVAWTGHEYLVVLARDDVRAAHITRGLELLDETPLMSRNGFSGEMILLPRDDGFALAAYEKTLSPEFISREIARFLGDAVDMTHRRSVGHH